MKTIKQIFLKEFPVNTILSIHRGKDPYISRLNNEVNTSANTFIVIKKLTLLGLVTVKRRVGNKNILMLTEEGKKVAELLKKIENLKKN